MRKLATVLLAVVLVVSMVGVGSADTPRITPSSPSGPVHPQPQPAAGPNDVLWNQPPSTVNFGSYADQDFEASFDAYDIYDADDFANDSDWTIESIFVPGGLWNCTTCTLTLANSLHWQIYADNGGVPAGDPVGGGAFWSLSLAPSDPQVTITPGVGGFPSDVMLNLTTPISLPMGNWWFVFYPQMDFSVGGQYGRQTSDTAFLLQAVVENPGGGFGFPPTWSPAPPLYGFAQYEFAFRLEGIPGVVQEPDIVVTPPALEATQAPDTITEQTLQICNVGTADLVWDLEEVPANRILAGPNVLLAFSDYGATTLHTALAGYGDLGTIDEFNTQVATPTLDQLLPYDVVMTWTNFQYFDKVAMGNVLADYVDAGGTVINTMFALGTGGWQMEGRFMVENYTAMNGGGFNFVQSCLGTYDPNHPVMQGITNVCDLFRMSGTYLTAGSTDVADWADGSIFVAVKDNQTVVTINGYAGDAFLYTGQMNDVIHNAILWLAQFEPFDLPWLSENPTSGTVAPGGCQDVTVTFDSTGLAVGDYFGALDIHSNDPDTPTVNVPVALHVTQQGDLLHINKMKINGGIGVPPSYARVMVPIRVYDQFQLPVEGVEALGEWTLPDGSVHPRTCATLTNVLGVCKFRLKIQMFGTFQLCVTDLVKVGYVYDPAANQDGPCKSITVNP